MQEELAKVVDRVGYEGGNGEVVGARGAVVLCEVLDIDAGEV